MTLNVIFIMKQILVNDRVEYDMDISSDDIKSRKSILVRYSESSDWSKPGETVLILTDTNDNYRIAFPNKTVLYVEYYEMHALLGAVLIMNEDKLTITEQIKILEI